MGPVTRRVSLRADESVSRQCECDEVTVDGVDHALVGAISGMTVRLNHDEPAVVERRGEPFRRLEWGGGVAGRADNDNRARSLRGNGDGLGASHRPQRTGIPVREVRAEARSHLDELVDGGLDLLDSRDVAVVKARDGEECLELVSVRSVLVALVVVVVQFQEPAAVAPLGRCKGALEVGP